MKWTPGQAYRQQGQYWFFSTHSSQPGNSGSPYINEKGNVVGVVHRVPERRAVSKGVQVYSVGTASQPLRDLFGAIGTPASEKTLDELYPDPARPVSASEAVEHQLSYLGAHQGTALLKEARADGKKEVPMGTLLAEACAEGLEKKNFRGIDQVSRSIEPCERAISWMECREKEQPRQRHLFCPAGPDRAFWQQSLASVAERLQHYNLPGHYNWLTFNPAILEESEEKGNATALQGLNAFAAESRPELSFELAYYKINFAGTLADLRQNSLDLIRYVRDYRKQPFYSRSFNWIISGLTVLYDRQQITQPEFIQALNRILTDSSLPTEEKLQLEVMAYRRGLFRIKD
jgi:hypothetical protein